MSNYQPLTFISEKNYMGRQEKDWGLDQTYRAAIDELEATFRFLGECLLPAETQTEINRLHVWLLSVQGAHFPWDLCTDTKKLERLGELDTIQSDLRLAAGDILDARPSKQI